MPDFEALIRQQQTQQPNSDQRLKVVPTQNSKVKQVTNNHPKMILLLFAGFLGSIIGSLTMLFIYINEFIPIELLKIK